MFENGGDDEGPRGPSSDRYGIMEKLKRLQEGEDLDELLKKFVVSILKKAAAKSGNKVDDLLVAQLEKALFE